LCGTLKARVQSFILTEVSVCGAWYVSSVAQWYTCQLIVTDSRVRSPEIRYQALITTRNYYIISIRVIIKSNHHHTDSSQIVCARVRLGEVTKLCIFVYWTQLWRSKKSGSIKAICWVKWVCSRSTACVRPTRLIKPEIALMERPQDWKRRSVAGQAVQ